MPENVRLRGDDGADGADVRPGTRRRNPLQKFQIAEQGSGERASSQGGSSLLVLLARRPIAILGSRQRGKPQIAQRAPTSPSKAAGAAVLAARSLSHSRNLIPSGAVPRGPVAGGMKPWARPRFNGVSPLLARSRRPPWRPPLRMRNGGARLLWQGREVRRPSVAPFVRRSFRPAPHHFASLSPTF